MSEYIIRFLHFKDSRVEKAWREMETPSMSPYLYYDYMGYIARYTRRHTFYRVKVACIMDGATGEILMLVPLKGSLTLSYFKMLGDIQGCDRTDALYQPRLSQEERRDVTRFFYSSMPRKMKLYRLQEGSPMVSELPQERLAKTGTNPYVRIAVPDDYDAFLKTLSPSVRQNLRTAANRMRRDGKEFTVEMHDNRNPVTDAEWKEIMDLYFRRLFTKYKSRKVRNPFALLRQKYIYYRTKHDTLSLHHLPNSCHVLLRDGSRLVAFTSGLLTHDRSSYTVPRLAIDADYRFYSPGYLLLDGILRRLGEERITAELDMSRGDEKYKFDMGGTPYITTDLKVSQSL